MSSHDFSGLDRRSFLGLGATAAVAGLALGASRPALAQAAATGSTTPAPPPTPPASAARAAKAVAASEAAILRISREVWETAELSLAEVKSAQIHLRELRAAGFKIVSTGTSGVPTAFLAEWSQGSGGAKVGFLPEYDALPGLGNAPKPSQTAAASGNTSGHGCGHNMLGAGCTGGALVLKRMMEESGTPGTVRVYGCAAEETEGAKVYMAREGLFNDLDAALAWHPAPVACAGLVRTTAYSGAKIIFRGRTAHAGNSPWEGRSALKAAELFSHGVHLMREHILPTARLHHVYEQAGLAPNVVPDYAQLWMTIRDADRSKVDAMIAWMREIAEGAALATQTKAEFDLFFGAYDLLPNEPLARLLYRHLHARPLDWTADQHAFAKDCQKALGVPELGMATEMLPFIPETKMGGSTDVGDISYNTPTALFAWPTLPLGIGLHSWPVTACAGMSIGDKASLDTARILAGAGYDVMTDPELRAAARADFQKRRGDQPFVSPIPASRRQPLGLPEFLRRPGADELLAGLPV
jgi:aminobenzoyl-glutamate utilization protein B